MTATHNWLHTCPLSIKRRFDVLCLAASKFADEIPLPEDEELPWYIYDTKTHSYMFDIRYCPFCGKEL